MGVKVNEDIGHFFQMKKGLRQGDPLSPVLFNLVADMLATLITRARDNEQFRDLVPHLVDGGYQFSNTPMIRFSFWKMM